jgi:hypothetical protein
MNLWKISGTMTTFFGLVMSLWLTIGHGQHYATELNILMLLFDAIGLSSQRI